MTEPFDEYGERLRRVLHAEAEAVTPSPEGLSQIRGKIAEKQERRFGAWFTIPWLRPLAAVAAAIVIAGIAVSATPALKTFVQTGRFSPDNGQSGGGPVNGGQQVYTASPPVNPPRTAGSAAPHASPSRTVPSGTHVIPGRKCPPGENPITPPAGSTADQTASPAPRPQVTCGPDTATSAPPTQPESPPPATTPTQAPTSEAPTSGAQQPSAQSSP
ncbi:hypothetical protein [Actinoallomurus rhizosphaericola]|uniref:hypothetical protein n=1 Tax=Actinoallomurus rhizosphaericola TaxID=2952536 RepID=UPI0020919DDF|nr:hypothetical protein [Actinoallomurus rhizosphaericola]MCO5992456.1 hypothetical protein [Actinoallomurus rhizosphaericola]